MAISNLMEQIGSSKTVEVDETLVRHMILNTIRTHVKKFKNTHGPDVVIACDDKNFWRREIFPYYKAGRKKARESSGYDWNTIFDCLAKVREELKENSPYKVISVDTCEADDIIAVITQKFSATQKIIILSSDKDFAQLQKYKNVSQYSPILKKQIIEENPYSFLKEHIIRGDAGDGIPNIFSKDDVFVEKIRQKAIKTVDVNVWINQEPNEFCNEEMYRNYMRNSSLIDLTKIPTEIVNSILHTYDSVQPKSKQHFMNYMIANRLKNLIEVIDEF